MTTKQRLSSRITIVAAITFSVMLGTLHVYAAQQVKISNIRLISDGRTITLSDTPDGEFSKINPSALNKVSVKFGSEVPSKVTMVITEVSRGASDFILDDNIVYIAQNPTNGSAAEFEFYLKPRSENGIFALYISGTGFAYKVGYFGIKSKTLPFTVAKGQSFQYDEYKKSIGLRLVVNDVQRFKEWAEEAEKTTLALSRGDITAQISGSKAAIDTDTGIITIPAGEYSELIPGFGAAESNFYIETDISIGTEGWWSDNTFEGVKAGSINLTLPELSSDGLARGVNLEVVIYSDTAVEKAVPIAAVYDNGRLVCITTGGMQSLVAGESKTVNMKLQCADLDPSGSFSFKSMLWHDNDIIPLTSAVTLSSGQD